MRQVLVVDDEPDIRLSLRMILEDEGYRVAEAAEGKAAQKQILAAREGMVVLLDLNMPGMDGVALLEDLAKRKGMLTRHSVVLLTARAGRTMPLSLVNRLHELGIPVMSKPFDLDALVEVVRVAAARLS